VRGGGGGGGGGGDVDADGELASLCAGVEREDRRRLG